MLGGADNPNGELPSYITGADIKTCRRGLHVIPWWQPVNFPAPPVERGHAQSGQKNTRDTYNNGLTCHHS